MNALENAKQLKTELDSFRPLTGEIEARIMQKFRLDWNFHSNNIEGNSLTYGETKALILFGITAQGKPLKDHFEITGHNEAINWVVDLVKGETELTEVFIRQLHELLLKESHYKEAVTSEGKQTRRKIEVGKYKTQSNHVITNTGEPFFFATPEETPIKMQELIDWFRNERDKTGVNQIILASLFHYKFVKIHPFDDGNGRTARILMNFILMQFGFPPVIIRTEDKENYYRVLRLADADELEPFIEYIAENLVRSLEIMLKGAKGESIEEADDLDKELALLEQEIRSAGTKVSTSRNKDSLLGIFESLIVPLTIEFINVSEKFNKFYNEKMFVLHLDGSGNNTNNQTLDEVFTAIRSRLYQNDLGNNESIILNYFYKSFKQSGFGNFDNESKIFFNFEPHQIRISAYSSSIPVFVENAYYSEINTKFDVQKICKLISNQHKEFIKVKLNEINQVPP